VPNCTEISIKNTNPGPGDYETVKSIEKEAKD